jgi:multiple sugar transport system substrate-binding protein
VLASVYEEFADDPVLSVIGEVLEDAKARPPAPNYTEISDEMQRTLFAAYNGETDPRSAAESVREFLEGTLD